MQYDVGRIAEDAENLLYDVVKSFAASHSDVKPPEGQFREMWKRRIAILTREKVEKTGIFSADDLLYILQDTAATYYRATIDQETVKRNVRSSLSASALSAIVEKNSKL